MKMNVLIFLESEFTGQIQIHLIRNNIRYRKIHSNAMKVVWEIFYTYSSNY